MKKQVNSYVGGNSLSITPVLVHFVCDNNIPFSSKVKNSQAKPVTVSTVRLVSGVECVRINPERVERFGAAEHVAVSYSYNDKNGRPAWACGWLPLPVWEASAER